MKNKKRSVVIGAFVVIGMLIIVTLLVVFGNGSLFDENVEYIAFFDKSVKGLNVGAPVMFRGVAIGQVNDIRMCAVNSSKKNEESQGEIVEKLQWPIRVTIALSPSMMGASSNWVDYVPEAISRHVNENSAESNIKNLVKGLVRHQGMRVRLQNSSLLTGKLYVELTLTQEGEPTDEIMKDLEKGILPTSLSVFEKVFLSLGEKDLSSQVENFYAMSVQLGDFVRSGKFKKVLDDVAAVTDNARALTENGNAELGKLSGQLTQVVEHLDKQIQGLASDIQGGIKEITGDVHGVASNVNNAVGKVGVLADDADKLIADNRANVDDIVAKTQAAASDLESTLMAARELVTQLKAMTAPDSQLQTGLNGSLSEIEQTMAAARSLIEYLQRHPDAILRGRRGE